MFNPPVSSRLSQFEMPLLTLQESTPITPESGIPFTPQQQIARLMLGLYVLV